ncbi:MAG: hypothetical protein KA314_28535 [Chloroflexi bacterium]|nr:hypothetical protein [Chloroflexota bacterium]MBP8059804.1 hypothetical protein [Chloroflexota bacterium]
MTTEKPISRDEAIHQIATQLEGPISLAAFTEQVLALWHSTSKTASTTVRKAIRDYEQGKTIIFMILPIHLALAGGLYQCAFNARGRAVLPFPCV